jgi:putative DNA primase/helicase
VTDLAYSAIPWGSGGLSEHPAPMTSARSYTPHAPALVLDPADPVPSARAFVDRTHREDGVLALRHQDGTFYAYQRALSAYVERDEASVRANLYAFLESAQRIGKPAPTPFQPTKRKVEDVLDALRAVCNLPASSAAPCWLDDEKSCDPFDVLPVTNGLLDVPTRRLLASSPRFFTVNALDFRYEPRAPSPTRWHQFLDDLWPDDSESQATLQEWIGYLLTPRTRLQKSALFVGP